MADTQADGGDEHIFLGLTAEELTKRLQEGVQREIAAQLAAGDPEYGVEEDGRVYALLPDGRRVFVPGHLEPEADAASRRVS